MSDLHAIEVVFEDNKNINTNLNKDIKSVINNSGDNRPSTYVENDMVVYRASSLGSCIRSLVLSRRGYDPAPYPSDILKAFDQGNEWEPALVNYFRQQAGPPPLLGWSIYGQQREYSITVGHSRIVRCHVDGIARKFLNDVVEGTDVRKRTNPVVMEFKALGHSTFRKVAKDITSIPHYAWQVSVEMIATGYPCLLVLLDKDKSDINDQSTYTIFTKLIKEPPYSRADIIRRVRSIESVSDSDNLPNCEAVDFFCPFWPFHEHKEQLSIAIDNNTREHLSHYLKLDNDIKLLTKEKDTLRKTVLIPSLTQDGSYDIDDTYYLTKSTSTRRVVDIDALLSIAESKGIDISEYISFTDTTTFTPRKR